MTTTITPQDLLQLQEPLADALRALPGTVELRAFGSLAHGTADRFSDIDLELLTTDLDATVAARHAVLAQIAPIWLEWCIHPSHSGWAATILFDTVSPYQHLDLGITAVGQASSTGRLGADTVLWTQEAAAPCIVPDAPVPYAPAVGTVDHAMLEQLLSALRYAKARQRGQLLTAYRFAAALPGATIAMLDARRTGDLSRLQERPTTRTFLALDRYLSHESRRDLLGLLDFSTPERMDAAVLALLRHNLALHDALPGTTGFPPDVAARLLAFTATELGR